MNTRPIQPKGDCPNCGTANTYETKLCTLCGELLPWAVARQRGTEQQSSPPPPTRTWPPQPSASSGRAQPPAQPPAQPQPQPAARVQPPRVQPAAQNNSLAVGCFWLLIIFVGIPASCNLTRPRAVGPVGVSLVAPRVTKAEYDQLRADMSYSEAAAIIGDPGQELSRSDTEGFTTVMYSWENGDGSNMNAMFQNDRLINKAQFGLR